MRAVVGLIHKELGRIVEDVNEKDIESVESESYRVDWPLTLDLKIDFLIDTSLTQYLY